jgi:hypothetical protein
MVDMARRDRVTTRLLSREQAERALVFQDSGVSPTKAASDLGCGFQRVWDIYRGKTWKWLREELEEVGTITS